MRLKIKNANVVAVPAFPRTFEFAYDDLEKGTVGTNGNPSGSGYSALGLNLMSSIPKTPCRISISAKAYTIDGHRYQPIVRLAGDPIIKYYTSDKCDSFPHGKSPSFHYYSI